MTFRVVPLSRSLFAPMFALDDDALRAHRAIRMPAPPGSPCRVSLIDAVPDEPILLIHHVHQPADTPFHASHAIYVREAAVEADPAPGEIPPALLQRMLSLRTFDHAGYLIDAELVAGSEAGGAIGALFDLPGMSYLHAHYAAYGCYAARIDRA